MTIIKMQQFRAVLEDFCLGFAIILIFNSLFKEIAANKTPLTTFFFTHEAAHYCTFPITSPVKWSLFGPILVT